MNNVIEVVMGGLEIADNQSEFKTFVGSCVAICLYDPNAKIGAMAHVMLPKYNLTKPLVNSDEIGKYADHAVNTMIDKLISKGADMKKIKAKMAGGATIFSHESNNDLFNIGPRNVKALRSILTDKKIPLVSEDTGLGSGRWIKFNVNTGDMIVVSSIKKTEKKI